MQEGFRSYETFDERRGACAKLLEAARILGCRGSSASSTRKGSATPPPSSACEDEPVIEKTVFSAVRADGFALSGRDQAVVCGIETHVCVSQTVHDLLQRGIEVHVPADAVGSRHERDYRGASSASTARARSSRPSSRSLFELLGAAGTPEFKQVQALVK